MLKKGVQSLAHRFEDLFKVSILYRLFYLMIYFFFVFLNVKKQKKFKRKNKIEALEP